MKYMLWVILLFAGSTSAEFYTQNLPVTDLSLGGSSLSGFRVKLGTMENTGYDCSISSWYMYPYSASDPNYSAVYSTLLASKVSGAKVGIQIVGCVTSGDRTYPKITHVYFCDTPLCG